MRLRYSLRSMLTLVCGVAVLCAAGVLIVRPALMQKRGREWVATQRGHVVWAHKYDSQTGTFDHTKQLTTPTWLVEFLGIDFFDTVHMVILDNQTVDDLAPLHDFENLRCLGIMVDVDPQLDFSPLEQFKVLEELHLGYTGLTEVRLNAIHATLPNVSIKQH